MFTFPLYVGQNCTWPLSANLGRFFTFLFRVRLFRCKKLQLHEKRNSQHNSHLDIYGLFYCNCILQHIYNQSCHGCFYKYCLGDKFFGLDIRQFLHKNRIGIKYYSAKCAYIFTHYRIAFSELYFFLNVMKWTARV